MEKYIFCDKCHKGSVTDFKDSIHNAMLITIYLSLKKLDLYDADLKEYYSLSHSLGIVPKDLNKLKDKLFGIECNFEELNGIDFKKGCYVGQENTARIKLKNKLSKRLFPINVINGKINEGESIYNNQIEIGKILIDSDYPFALIKYLNENFDEKSKTQDISKKDKPFRFFDNRQKYLSFVNTCNEKWKIAERAAEDSPGGSCRLSPGETCT